MKLGSTSTPTVTEYLSSLPAGSVVGIDPNLHTISDATKLIQTLNEKNIQIRAVEPNLVDSVWGDLQPGLPKYPVRVHDLKYAGMTVQEKLTKIREKMRAEKIGSLVVGALDEVCWLFNIRGCDSEFNQLALAYALVTNGKEHY